MPTRIPDIMRYIDRLCFGLMANRVTPNRRYYKILIMNAKFEIFLATNYWQASWASHLCVSSVVYAPQVIATH